MSGRGQEFSQRCLLDLGKEHQDLEQFFFQIKIIYNIWFAEEDFHRAYRTRCCVSRKRGGGGQIACPWCICDICKLLKKFSCAAC